MVRRYIHAKVERWWVEIGIHITSDIGAESPIVVIKNSNLDGVRSSDSESHL